MKTELPAAPSHQLRTLWKEAFGDTDDFLDLFFGIAYDPDRSRFIRSQGRVVAALYWLDMLLDGQKFAYIYAVATARDHRGKGLCRLLMADTAAVLKGRGYCGALLVPQDEGLRAMYSSMGYHSCAPVDVFFCAAGGSPVSATEITAEEYTALRLEYLPGGSVTLGERALAFLAASARFYRGEGFVAAVSRETEHLRILEYLGCRQQIPGLIAALGATEATVRVPGSSTPFAMYLPLTPDCPKPEYYPFAFD